MQQVKVNLLSWSSDDELVATTVNVLLSSRQGRIFYKKQFWTKVLNLLLLLQHTVHFEIEDSPRHHPVNKRFSPLNHVFFKLLFAGLLHVLPPRGGQPLLSRDN